jgi:hypothetical protein
LVVREIRAAIAGITRLVQLHGRAMAKPDQLRAGRDSFASSLASLRIRDSPFARRHPDHAVTTGEDPMPRLTLAAAALAAGLAASAHADSLTVLDQGTNFWELDADYAGLDKQWFAVGRNLDSGPNTWEIGVGNDLTGGGLATADLTWDNAVTYGFELSYDGDVMDLAILDGDAVLNSVSYDIASTSFDTLMFQLKARNNGPQSSAMAMVTGLEWSHGGSTSAVAGSFLASSMGDDKVWAALGGAGDLGGSAWTLSGDVMFSWIGAAPTNDFSAFEFKGVQVVPVPAPVLMAGLGLLGAAGMRRRLTRD